jgi:hypothetical protein
VPKSYLLAGIAVVALSGFGPPHRAEAALVKRSMLIQACTAHDQARLNDCAGYIAGLADANDSVQQGVCIPPGLNVRLLRQGVTNWLQSHTTSDGPAATSVLTALRALYRCPG